MTKMQLMKKLKEEIQSAVNIFKSGNLSKAEHVSKKLIKENPNIVFLYNLLGLILSGQGKSEQAIECYEEGIKIDPNFAMIYNNLALLLVSRQSSSDMKKAENYYKKSILLDEKIAEPHNNLGSLYNFRGKYKNAVDCYKKALSINSKFSTAHFNLGTVLITTGKFNEARKNLLEAIKLNPNFIHAHRTLSRITRYADNDEHFKVLKNLYKNIDISNTQGRIDLSFALGKAYEDVKNFDKSFTHYNEANSLCRKRISFSLTDENAKFQEIKDTFNEKLFDKFHDSGSKNSSSIFILGMPRSGTTLIEQILSSHPKVFGADEVETVPYLIKKFFFEGIMNFDKVNLRKMGDEYISKMKDFSNNSEKTTDKLPINFLSIGLIKLILPNSKIIHCFRNPRDNIFSIFKNNFTTNKVNYSYALNEIIEYYNLYHDLMSHWNTILPNFIYNIKYETLISNTESEIRDLLKFCELEWAKDCLSFYNNKRPIKTASDTQARNKIYKTSINSWKNYEKQLRKYFVKLKS